MPTFLEGKKTYITAALIAAGAVAQALGYIVPEWVWAILAATGFASVRQAIGRA